MLEQLTPEMIAALQNGQQPPLTVIALHDNQFVSLVAAVMGSGGPTDRVTAALDIIAETLVQMGSGALPAAIEEAKRRKAMTAKALTT